MATVFGVLLFIIVAIIFVFVCLRARRLRLGRDRWPSSSLDSEESASGTELSMLRFNSRPRDLGIRALANASELMSSNPSVVEVGASSGNLARPSPAARLLTLIPRLRGLFTKESVFGNDRELTSSDPEVGEVGASEGSLARPAPVARLSRFREEGLVMREEGVTPVAALEAPGYNDALTYPEDVGVIRDGARRSVTTLTGEHTHSRAFHGDGIDGGDTGDLGMAYQSHLVHNSPRPSFIADSDTAGSNEEVGPVALSSNKTAHQGHALSIVQSDTDAEEVAEEAAHPGIPSTIPERPVVQLLGEATALPGFQEVLLTDALQHVKNETKVNAEREFQRKLGNSSADDIPTEEVSNIHSDAEYLPGGSLGAISSNYRAPAFLHHDAMVGSNSTRAPTHTLENTRINAAESTHVAAGSIHDDVTDDTSSYTSSIYSTTEEPAQLMFVHSTPEERQTDSVTSQESHKPDFTTAVSISRSTSIHSQSLANAILSHITADEPLLTTIADGSHSSGGSLPKKDTTPIKLHPTGLKLQTASIQSNISSIGPGERASNHGSVISSLDLNDETARNHDDAGLYHLPAKEKTLRRESARSRESWEM
jgi:hypothetical protein